MAQKTDDTGDSLEQVLKDLKGGKLRPAFLLYGDDAYRVQDALAKLIDVLLPPADRDLNLFILDGERVNPDELCEMLTTCPLLPGRKVVVVRGATFFHSKQTLGALIEKIRERLDREPAKAARDMMTFLALTGLRLDDLVADGWKRISDEDWSRLVEGEGGAQRETWLPKALELCVQLGAREVSASDDTERLGAVLQEGLPEGHVLLLTAEAVDRRKKFFKVLGEVGAVVSFAQVKGEARLRAGVVAATRDRLSASGKTLSEKAWQVLGLKTGFDLASSVSAIEKLIVHAGERAVISDADVTALVGKSKEESVFDLTAALTRKDARQALAILDDLLEQGTQPLMILTMLAREVRLLLQAKIVLLYGELDGFDARMDYGAFQRRIYPGVKALCAPGKGNGPSIDLGGQHPFVLFNAFKNSGLFSYEALQSYLQHLARTDLQMKTSQRNPRLLLERFIWTACA